MPMRVKLLTHSRVLRESRTKSTSVSAVDVPVVLVHDVIVPTAAANEAAIAVAIKPDETRCSRCVSVASPFFVCGRIALYLPLISCLWLA